MENYTLSRQLQAYVQTWDVKRGRKLLGFIQSYKIPENQVMDVVRLPKEIAEQCSQDELFFDVDTEDGDVWVYFRSEYPDVDICPYDQDMHGVLTYCKCSPQRRQECADDI